MQEDNISEAKEKKMTEADLAMMMDRIDCVVYAEWATTGSMGACGVTTIYVLEGKSLFRYVASYYEGQETQYSGAFKILNDASDQTWEADLKNDGILRDLLKGPQQSSGEKCHVFESIYAGYGNYVWKNKLFDFGPNDEKNGFVVEHDGAKYLIECSVKGVYLLAKDRLIGTSNKKRLC